MRAYVFGKSDYQIVIDTAAKLESNGKPTRVEVTVAGGVILHTDATASEVVAAMR
jgi:hypothetical protein